MRASALKEMNCNVTMTTLSTLFSSVWHRRQPSILPLVQFFTFYSVRFDSIACVRVRLPCLHRCVSISFSSSGCVCEWMGDGDVLAFIVMILDIFIGFWIFKSIYYYILFFRLSTSNNTKFWHWWFIEITLEMERHTHECDGFYLIFWLNIYIFFNFAFLHESHFINCLSHILQAQKWHDIEVWSDFSLFSFSIYFFDAAVSLLFLLNLFSFSIGFIPINSNAET